jgi:hypothetical protein
MVKKVKRKNNVHHSPLARCILHDKLSSHLVRKVGDQPPLECGPCLGPGRVARADTHYLAPRGRLMG